MINAQIWFDTSFFAAITASARFVCMFVFIYRM